MKLLYNIIGAIVICLMMSAVAVADGDSSVTDESITIDLGEGNGSVIVIGDSNVVYLPDSSPSECEIARATRIGNGYILVLPQTEIRISGIVTRFLRIVLYIGDDGVTEVLEAVQ